MRTLYVCAYLQLLVHINGIITRTHAIYRIQITASESDEDAVYLIESVVGGLHICKRVRSPTVCEGLQLSREDRNDDCFTACHQVYIFLICLSGSWPSRVVCKAVLLLVPHS